MDNKKANKRYDDIINLPHHVSKKYPHMPLADRAAQFAPFAALTGHEAAVTSAAKENAITAADPLQHVGDVEAEWLEQIQRLIDDEYSQEGEYSDV